MHVEGVSIRALSRIFKVDRRLIQFVLFPEREAHNKKLRKAKGGSAQYYDKDKHAAAMRKHRKYKYNTLKNTLLNQ